MNMCIPVEADEGLASPVCAHFGSAPFFLIVDPGTGECRAIRNENDHHGGGGCQPLDALAGERIEGMVVGGIGRGAIMKLNAAGVRVYLSAFETVAETLDAFRAGTLPEMDPAGACRGHAQRGGCH